LRRQLGTKEATVKAQFTDRPALLRQQAEVARELGFLLVGEA
jgi:hypothetical protein